ncbi:MAG: carboxymuconolactone decarboxylase family protein [Myxococcales bacterium]|nr:carboxymuconolactone decarboxylase family protein [Myxococcales bacterium]
MTPPSVDPALAGLLVEPPTRIPWYLRVGLWWARRATGKEPLPGRLLAHFPRGAVAAGLFELGAAHAPRHLGGRELATARLVASATAGCPFCIDMNAAGHAESGLSMAELTMLLQLDVERWHELGPREHAAARYARSLSSTPVVVPGDLAQLLPQVYTSREIVVLATTIAQVNYWARFCNGLGVPAAGFFDERACPLPVAREAPAR